MLDSGLKSVSAALNSIENDARVLTADEESALTIRLLAEEMTGMTRAVLGRCDGEIYIRRIDNTIEIHLRASAPVDSAALDEFVSLAKSKKNYYGTGIRGAIARFMGEMLIYQNDPHYEPMMSVGMGGCYGPDYSMWSMQSYHTQADEEAERDASEGGGKAKAQRELIEQLSDDVIVTVSSHKVNMTVKKNLK